MGLGLVHVASPSVRRFVSCPVQDPPPSELREKPQKKKKGMLSGCGAEESRVSKKKTAAGNGWVLRTHKQDHGKAHQKMIVLYKKKNAVLWFSRKSPEIRSDSGSRSSATYQQILTKGWKEGGAGGNDGCRCAPPWTTRTTTCGVL
jgi:hypothetical protein